MLSFLLLSICANSLILTLSIVAAIRRCCRGPPLKYSVQYISQDTIAASIISLLILWAGKFFVVRYSAVYLDRYIEAAVYVPISGTLSTFSCLLCLILSSRVSTNAVLAVPHIYFLPYPPSPL